MVGDRRRPLRAPRQVVVPARPRPPAARQQAPVGVQDGLVGLVGEGAEDLLLRRRRVGEHRERLVGVRGDDDLVEALGLAARRRDLHAVVEALDRAHGRREADAVGERRGERLDVALGAAGDGAPLRPPAQAEHAVVVEELDEEARRERPHLLRVGGPDRGGLRHDHALDERVGDAERRQPLAQRRLPGRSAARAPGAGSAGRRRPSAGTRARAGASAWRRARSATCSRTRSRRRRRRRTCPLGCEATPSSVSSASKRG